MKISNCKFRMWVVIVLVCICLLVVLPGKSDASSVSLGISPPILTITAEPPANIQSEITLHNLEEEPVQLSVQLIPFTASAKENGEVRFLKKDEPFGADPLMLERIDILDGNRKVTEVYLGPKQQKTLKVHITIPKDAPVSDYYFSIVFTSTNEAETDKTQSQTSAGIAANVLFTVGPVDKAKGHIEEFTAPVFLDKGPVPFVVRVENTGDHAVAPQGEILITNMFGQTVGKVNLAQVNILAGTIRAIPDQEQVTGLSSRTEGERSQNDVRYTEYPLAVWPESFLLGPYTATLRISLTDEGPLYERATTFFAFPLQGVIGIFFAVLIVLWIRARIKKLHDS